MRSSERFPSLLAVLALAACTAREPEAPITAFSRAAPGGELPGTWQRWTLDPRKPPTRFSLVKDGARTVVRAEAERSVSGLVHDVSVDPYRHARLRWRWKVGRLPDGADERVAQGDDSPARVVVSFTGDLGRLDAAERAKLALAAAFSGRPAPYATLMYTWSIVHAPGTVIVNPRSTRVRMIVVEQGSARLGRWLEYERNLVGDFRHAFGEDPGLVTSIGVLTDADDTQSSALAYYGDIALR